MRKLYRVLVDPKDTTRWYLRTPIDPDGKEIDPRVFTSGNIYDGETNLTLPLRREGLPINFNFCDFDMIVITKQLNDAIQHIAGNAIQRIPISVEAAEEPYEILNVVNTISCVDGEKSEYTRWQPQDGRLDKVGQYRMITRLVIDPEKAKGYRIFRPKEWKIALIVDEGIKEMFEQCRVTGVIFEAVN